MTIGFNTIATSPIAGDGSLGGLPSPPPSAGALPPEFWGMHTTASTLEPWPLIPFKTQRLWDSYPYISWNVLNPALDTYNWSTLDAHVAVSVAHGVDIIYTFGYLPAWVNADQTAVPDDASWEAFVTAIVGRTPDIEYWQLWNEPNSTTFWSGTPAQMAHLASIAAPIIRAAGKKVLSPCPQGSNAHLWMKDFLDAGGGAFVDIITFNSYTYFAPETLIDNVAALKMVLSNAGQGSKEIWDTEHSWGDSTWPFGGTDELREAYLARLLAISPGLGIARSIWYSYDNVTFGTLADKTTDLLVPAGQAYLNFYNWFAGKIIGEAVETGTTYSVSVTDGVSYNGLLVWDTSGPTAFATPAGMFRYRNLENVEFATTPGTGVTIGIKPILFDNMGAVIPPGEIGWTPDTAVSGIWVADTPVTN